MRSFQYLYLKLRFVHIHSFPSVLFHPLSLILSRFIRYAHMLQNLLLFVCAHKYISKNGEYLICDKIYYYIYISILFGFRGMLYQNRKHKRRLDICLHAFLTRRCPPSSSSKKRIIRLHKKVLNSYVCFEWLKENCQSDSWTANTKQWL